MKHTMHVENKPCDCGANDCHGHTVHHLICSCGYKDSSSSYDLIPKMVREHAPNWATYQQAMKDTEYPR